MLELSLGQLIKTLQSAEGAVDLDLNQPIAGSETPLGQAAFGGSTEYVELMLEHGADPNYLPNDNAMHPLVSAMCRFTGNDDRADIVKLAELMLDAGMNTSAVAQDRSLLMEAAYYDLPELCRFLLENGADAEFENGEGVGALALAQSAQSEDALAALCDYLGEDIEKWTASARMTVAQLLEYFTDPEPSVHSRDGIGHTPLHLAAELGQIYLLADLLGMGADLEALDDKGQTPIFKVLNADLDTDTARGTLDELILLGARLDVVNKFGQTVLDVALEQSWFKPLAERLQEHGAKSAK